MNLIKNEFRTTSRNIQLMLVRHCNFFLQIIHYFNITTENPSEFNFRGILNEKKRIKLAIVLKHRKNCSRHNLTSPCFL